MEEPLLEIGVYFDEHTDPVTQEHLSLAAAADTLLIYPLHLFRGKHHITLHHPGPGAPGFLMLSTHLVSDPHIASLQGLKEQGAINGWAVFPPGTWTSSFEDQQARGRAGAPGLEQ